MPCGMCSATTVTTPASTFRRDGTTRCLLGPTGRSHRRAHGYSGSGGRAHSGEGRAMDAEDEKVAGSTGSNTLWIASSFAQGWLRDAIAETRQLGPDHRRREVLFSVC